jgi:hypothetical protein
LGKDKNKTKQKTSQMENRMQPIERPRARWAVSGGTEVSGEGPRDCSGQASPEKSARKPWVRELMTSISCRDTVCTTSLRFWSSPSGHCTNLVYKARGGV